MTVKTPDSFAEYLAPVAASISPSLISPDAFSKMSEVARLIPGSLAHNTFGFECRLGEDLPHADFLVRATTARGRESLTALPAYPLVHPAWDRVRDFALGWTDSSLLSRTVDNIWLEFDLTGPQPEVPSAFFGFRPAVSAEESVYKANVRGHLAATFEAVRLLTCGEMSSLASETLSGCFHALPESVQVFQVGMMLSRPTEAVRLCLRLRSFEDALRYLERVDWSGNVADLGSAFEPMSRLPDYLCLNVDVGETVHPKVGLECYVAGREKWASILEDLVSSGLCTTSKRDSLLAYPGYVTESGVDVPWPPALSRASELLGSRSSSVFVRSLHHAKVVYKPGGSTEAKAYLAVNHRWHTPQRNARV